jgi:glycosyltransferase involved in cell wall biosynthesis
MYVREPILCELASHMLVSICIITYKRPQELKRLLNKISQLVFNKVEQPDIEVIVVDNDTAEVAESICHEIKTNFLWSLKTGTQPQRGITYARNKSISLASLESNFIALIDDDEVPELNWLDELLFVQQKYQADIVTGTVLAHFQANNPPQWAVKGNFFNFPRYETGAKRHVAFTNNVLIRRNILRQLNPVFDNRFAITGGEDTYLFTKLHKNNCKIVWADEAIVHDWIPASRTTIKWILRRNYWSRGIHSLVEKELIPSFKVQLIRFCKGISLILIGLCLIFPSLALGKSAIVKALIYIFQGAGTLAGLMGIRYQEYKLTNLDVINHQTFKKKNATKPTHINNLNV